MSSSKDITQFSKIFSRCLFFVLIKINFIRFPKTLQHKLQEFFWKNQFRKVVFNLRVSTQCQISKRLCALCTIRPYGTDVILECRCALSSNDFNSPKTLKSLRRSHSSHSFVLGSVKSDLVRIIIIKYNTNTRDSKGFAEHVVRENGPDIILNINFRYNRYETRDKSKHFTDLVFVFEIRAHQRRRCT